MSSESPPLNDSTWTEDVARWQRVALIVGAAGLGVLVVGSLVAGFEQFFRAYLIGFQFVLGVGLGCLALLMMQYVTGGSWGWMLRRPLEAGTRTFPVLALLFVPLAVGMLFGYLYEWADPEHVEHDKALQVKIAYLNVPFALVRTVLYFAVWSVLMWFLNRWSRRYDETGDQAANDACSGLSGPGLVLFAITVTFASIDWLMSLEPHWYSTIYGALIGMGEVLSGFTFCVVVLLVLAPRSPVGQVMREQTQRDMGSLLMTFVMVWAYLAFSQFLLIWSGNLPEEVPWYVKRVEGGWGVVALSLVLLHFAIPFVLLLMVDIKRDRRSLTGVALLVLLMRVVDTFWLIAPAYQSNADLGLILLGLAAVAGLGGVWLGVYLWQLRQRPLMPARGNPAEENNHG